MTYEWTLFIDLGIIAIALAIATLLRAKVPFFQRFLIPNALTAGFILLVFYNVAAPALGLGTQNLGGLVFHLLNISFISMSLKEGSMKGAGKRIFGTAISVVAHYAIQVAIGLGITALFIITIKPDLFLNFGFFLALGYGLGPGQSFAIGKAWEGASEGFKGFANAGNIGLIFAAIGYLWGCIGGVWLINYGRKKGWVDADTHAAIGEKTMRTGVFGRNEKGPVGAVLRTDTEAIDSMSFYSPVYVGNLITLKASLNYVGKTSMEVGVRVEAEDVLTGQVTHTNSAYLVYVALDENLQPVEVPPLQPETAEEERRMQEGRLRQEERKRRRQTDQAKHCPA